MLRNLTASLLQWFDGPQRLPLVLRGARQVGKTWLVRDLAAQRNRDLVELNFERDPRLQRVFTSNDPHRMVADLGIALGRDVAPDRSLLFLDEIQAAPPVLNRLRWFAEEMPELPVVAAGSLLEFALTDAAVRSPVGRVTFRHVEPMDFSEFLLAHGQDPLLERLRAWYPGEAITDVVHERARSWYERFAMVGGMPAVVTADVERADAARCRRLQADLITAYRDDFARYTGRLDRAILDRVLLATADQLGAKFVYARVGEGVKQHQAKNALELLAKARLVTLVAHATGTAPPLGGSVHARNRKAILLDVGLAHALLATPGGAVPPRWDQLADAVRGKLSAQLAGQQLRALDPAEGGEPGLYYWQRGAGRAGEIDFLIQPGHLVVPVELKSGKAGSLKSLHLFVHESGLGLAMRVDANPPSLQELDVKTTLGDQARYRILNLPGYLLWRCAELLTAIGGSG
ncbi:MAG TPA: AAA family ATPase [Planctomycetota bacterium]|nr:AAA family ATPase [Planctomycetota bacterium]